MTRLTFIIISLCACLASYYVGRANPSDYHAAQLIAQGYDQGRQSVLDELPKPKAEPVKDMTAQCIAWWAGSNIKEAKKRFCQRGA